MSPEAVRAQVLMLQARLRAFCQIENGKPQTPQAATAAAAEAFEKGLNDGERVILLRLGIYTLGVGRV